MLRRLPSKASSERENSELNKRVEIFFFFFRFKVINLLRQQYFQRRASYAKYKIKKLLKANACLLRLLQVYAGILARQGFHKMYILHILAVFPK